MSGSVDGAPVERPDRKLPLVFLWSGCLLFSTLFVYGVIYHYNYFASLMILFFLPSVLMGYYIWTRGDKCYCISIIIILSICFMFSVLLEYIAVYLKFWTFFTDKDPLIGLYVGDIPIEEFLFYFGANMQLCFLYSSIRLKFDSMGFTAQKFRNWFKRERDKGIIVSDKSIQNTVYIVLGIFTVILSVLLIKRYRKEGSSETPAREYRDKRGLPVYIEGRWYPGWFIAIVPFLVFGILWLRATLKKINIPALFLSAVLNITLYLLFEYNAIMRGHWVYNEQRLLGLRLAGTIPVEQLILYFVSFLFIVPFFETTRNVLINMYGNSDEKLSDPVSSGSLSIAKCRNILNTCNTTSSN